MTVGIPFLGSLAVFSNNVANGGQGLGLHII
jgi:hypothetical protein